MKKPTILMFTLLALATVLCLAATVTMSAWARRGDEVSLMSPSEWGFGQGWWDGRDTGGRVYRYGFFERTTGMHPRQRP